MDDFSFPTIAADNDSSLCQLPFPHFATSPLWFLSTATTIDGEETTHEHRTSISPAKEAVKISKSDSKGDKDGNRFVTDEEKMDLLWEDFNEELPCRMKRRMEKASDASATASESDADRNGMVELRCMHAGKLIHHRRPSLLLMLKVLKKLFLIQK